MKVLSITNNDFRGAGGTSIASFQLHEGLKNAGVSSRILCRHKTSGSPDSIEIPYSPLLENGIRNITWHLGLNDINAVSAFNIPRHEAFRQADIVHLHSLHTNYFSYLALPRLTRQKPTVWTLHDVWAVTGHCGANFDCERWKTGCGKCPYPDVYPSIRRDATRWEWKLKKWAYKHSKLTLVVASQWFADVLKQSILSQHPLHVIPWGVDINVFKPLDRAQCRNVLGIPRDKKVLMFVALQLDDHRKGADLLAQALKNLSPNFKKELVLLTMGVIPTGFNLSTDIPTINLGWVGDPLFKAVAYSAADVFVSPTRAETFGLTLIESLACGTPVVSFAIGPVPEIIRQGLTGYTAQPQNTEDLLKGILMFFEDPALCHTMGSQGRDMVVREYSLDLEIKRYLELYRKMLA